jgi:hypothetical protein
MQKKIIRCSECWRTYTQPMIITRENVLQPGRKTKADIHYCIRCYNKGYYENDNTRTTGDRKNNNPS